MGFFDFLKSSPKKEVAGDLSFLGVDMHSHVLPGLDDGSQNLEDSFNFAKELHGMGYNKLICTPHVISDMYPNNKSTIDPAYELLKAKLAAENIPLELDYAAEFMVNEAFENIITDGQLLTFGKNYVLIEMSYLYESPNIKEMVFELLVQGLQPVLAHPERYNFYNNNYDGIKSFIDAGCLLQVNLLSFTGYYGKPAKHTAEMMVKDKILSFAGTDLHHYKHLGMLKRLSQDRSITDQLRSVELKNNTL